jgi:hypothetical protein
MKLGLRMGLNSRQGGGGDLPSLDLAFALDKTLTPRKGPMPTFTRSSTATFIGSNGLIQSAAINIPRFDHDPATGASKGLLIEEERRNFLARSEEFETTWVPSNTTVLPNQTVSPNGQTTADKLVEVASLSQHFISQQTTKAASSITYAFSVYYKNASGTRNLILAITNGTSAGRGAIFTTSGSVAAANISAGSGIGFTIISAVVENAGCGWYRASITVSSDTSTRLDGVIYLSNSSSSITVYDGDGTSGIFLWGAQLEAGAFPTSYIPTATTSLTRSADVCSITGDAFSGFYNQPEGTIFSSAMIAYLIGENRGIVQLDDGTNNNNLRHAYNLANGGFIGSIRANADTQTTLSVIVGSSSTIQKRAIAYEGTAFASTSNGGAIASVTRTMPVGLNAMRIGNFTGGSFQLNGHIASIRYYRKRLSNEKLVTLTAP